MKVGVVYQLIPEETKFYVIDNPTEEELTILRSAAGSYGNTDDETEDGNKIGEWLGERWSENEVDGTKPIDGPLDSVICLGFYL